MLFDLKVSYRTRSDQKSAAYKARNDWAKPVPEMTTSQVDPFRLSISNRYVELRLIRYLTIQSPIQNHWAHPSIKANESVWAVDVIEGCGRSSQGLQENRKGPPKPYMR